MNAYEVQITAHLAASDTLGSLGSLAAAIDVPRHRLRAAAPRATGTSDGLPQGRLRLAG